MNQANPKGGMERYYTRCYTCLDWGLNETGCRGQPVSSGRRERAAREWLGEIEIILEDLELEEEEGFGYESSELSDLDNSNIEQMETEDDVAERRIMRFV